MWPHFNIHRCFQLETYILMGHTSTLPWGGSCGRGDCVAQSHPLRYSDAREKSKLVFHLLLWAHKWICVWPDSPCVCGLYCNLLAPTSHGIYEGPVCLQARGQSCCVWLCEWTVTITIQHLCLGCEKPRTWGDLLRTEQTVHKTPAFPKKPDYIFITFQTDKGKSGPWRLRRGDPFMFVHAYFVYKAHTAYPNCFQKLTGPLVFSREKRSGLPGARSSGITSCAQSILNGRCLSPSKFPHDVLHIIFLTRDHHSTDVHHFKAPVVIYWSHGIILAVLQ